MDEGYVMIVLLLHMKEQKRFSCQDVKSLFASNYSPILTTFQERYWHRWVLFCSTISSLTWP